MRRTQAGGATAQSRCALPQASPARKTPSSCPHVQAPAHPLALWQSRARSWFSALFSLSLSPVPVNQPARRGGPPWV